MKVLLLGEYSGFHTTLRDGLRVLGHDAIVAGTGDGSKAIPVDRDIGTTWTGPLGTAARIAKAVQFTAITPKVDVLQLINPHIFPRGAGLNDALIRRLRGKVPRLFLSACGDDAFFVQEGIHALRYNPIDDATIYDLGLDRHPLTDPRELRWNEALADMADGVIPVMYEYQLGYAGRPSLRPNIPLPVNTDKVKALPNRPGDRLVVMHGAGRAGFKGSRHILKAFETLKEKHPGRFEFIHVTNLPIGQYLELMARVNVVVDQANSYSCGMNALFAMAMGKIVLGGAEPESLTLYEGAPTPVRNIRPDPMDVVRELEALLDLRPQLPEMGDRARHFIEEHHDYRTIAARYIDAWTKA